MFRPIHGHHQVDCLKYLLCNKFHCVTELWCGDLHIIARLHELAETCRWLISRIYCIFFLCLVVLLTTFNIYKYLHGFTVAHCHAASQKLGWDHWKKFLVSPPSTCPNSSCHPFPPLQIPRVTPFHLTKFLVSPLSASPNSSCHPLLPIPRAVLLPLPVHFPTFPPHLSSLAFHSNAGEDKHMAALAKHRHCVVFDVYQSGVGRGS